MDKLINDVHHLSEEMADIITLIHEGDEMTNQQIAAMNQYVLDQMDKLTALDEKLDRDLELMENRKVLGQKIGETLKYMLANKPKGATITSDDEDEENLDVSVQPDNSRDNSFINNIGETPHLNTNQPAMSRSIVFSAASGGRSIGMSPGMDIDQDDGRTDIVQFVGDDEFDSVPSYLKCRMKVCTVNELVSVFNTVLTKKYEYLSKPRSTLKSNEKIFDLYSKWQSQATQLQQREKFCTGQDFLVLNNFKLSKKELNLIAILRHLGRLKQKQIKDQVFYIANETFF